MIKFLLLYFLGVSHRILCKKVFSALFAFVFSFFFHLLVVFLSVPEKEITNGEQFISHFQNSEVPSFIPFPAIQLIIDEQTISLSFRSSAKVWETIYYW